MISTLGKTTSKEIMLNGSTLLELIELDHEIELIHNAPTKMIRCIDSVCIKNSYSWTIYVNTKKVLSSVDNYIPKKEDIILIKFGEMK